MNTFRGKINKMKKTRQRKTSADKDDTHQIPVTKKQSQYKEKKKPKLLWKKRKSSILQQP